MKQTKLLKSILIPTLGISAISTIPVVSTSCSCGSENPDIIYVTAVTLNKISTTLAVGDTETLIATVLPENATNKTVTWGSSDTSVAAVDANGKITAVGLGNATITVTTNDGGLTATCVVTVNSVHITSITLNKTSTTLAVGDTETLTATVLPENATDKSVTWSSNNESVAVVNENGTITAVGVGNATVAVTTNDGGLTATCAVNVTNVSEYVGITANEKSTLKLINNSTNNNPDLQYSTDGIYWTICSESKQINISQGERLYLRGNNPTGWSHSDWNFSFLRITGDVSVSGNVMALLDNGAAPGEQGDITDIPCEYCFYSLFDGSTGITSISEDFLPATNLTNYCYSFMFEYCSSLVKAPNLPATTLADGCYAWMFPYCSALTIAPVLSATTLSTSCFEFMFADCISLSSIKIDYIGNYSDAYFLKWTTSVASSGTFYYNGNQNPQDFKLPSGWVKEGGQYVAITANKNSTLALYSSYGTTISPNLWYSIDNVNWTTYGSTININQGERLYLRGNNPTGWSHSSSDYSSLIIKGDVSISGSVMALLYNGSGPLTKIPNDYCFYHLFSCCEGITSVSEDFLPATILKSSCYEGMFYGCSSLTTAPELPATTLADSCYTWMFSTCFSLTKSPDLPAKTLAAHCYDNMFYSCIYLKSIKIGYTGNYDSTYFDHWVTNVATSGTFYYNGNQTAQDFQLPSGWTTEKF